MPANFLNRTALPSITGFEASGPMLPRPSTARAVGDHRDQVGARGEFGAGRRIGDDGLAGRGDARRIGQAPGRAGCRAAWSAWISSFPGRGSR